MLYLAMQDLFFDDKTKYYFSFFRIFRIEHAKIINYFLEYNWIDLSAINAYVFNKDMYYVGELFYNFFLINNQLKVMLLIAYFALLPLITILNFVLQQCTKLRCAWFDKNLGSKFFFGGTLLFIMVFTLPFGLSAILELYKGERDN